MKILPLSPIIVVGSDQLWERPVQLLCCGEFSRDFTSQHMLRTGYFACGAGLLVLSGAGVELFALQTNARSRDTSVLLPITLASRRQHGYLCSSRLNT